MHTIDIATRSEYHKTIKIMIRISIIALPSKISNHNFVSYLISRLQNCVGFHAKEDKILLFQKIEKKVELQSYF